MLKYRAMLEIFKQKPTLEIKNLSKTEIKEP
jgi:hypothetical protein